MVQSTTSINLFNVEKHYWCDLHFSHKEQDAVIILSSCMPNIRFRPVTIKSLIHDVLNEELSGKQYNSEECTMWTKTLSEAIKTRVKG